MGNLDLQKLLHDVSTKYLPNDFSEHIFDHYYGRMVHDEQCDYNPYDNLEYYNVHHHDEKTR